MSKVADLHLHTTHSDGTLTPRELARLAKAQGVDAIALTDHDTVSGIEELLDEGRILGLEVIPGVELSADFGPGTLHILGYGFDPKGPIGGRLKRFQKARAERNPQVLERLRELHMPLTLEEVKALSGATGQLGRPHIARALERKGYVRSYEEAFDRYLSKGKPAYVPKATLAAEECVKLIHESGGVAVAAHPVQMRLTGAALRDKLSELAALGMDGLEVIHPDHGSEAQTLFSDLADALGLLKTGGSDFHGDHKPGVQLGQGRPPYLFLEKLRNRISERRRRYALRN
ncbi:MAG TPA: PHP domain-containing protein [bacterium]|nr:PHP domain-containing protein [bacterium]